MSRRELMPISDDLKRCEKVIERGLGSFISVGEALLEIQTKKLYKQRGYTAFSLYCEREWNFAKSQAYRLIEAAKTVDEVSPIGDTLPATESQVRELAAAPVGERAAVWQGVVEAHAPEEITAAVIREHVQAAAPVATAPPAPVAAPVPAEDPAFARLRMAIREALTFMSFDVLMEIVREERPS